jgi:hypothetical protein
MQFQHAKQLIADARRVDAGVADIERTTDADAFTWKPAADAWSVGQIFEHLCVADDDYLGPLRRRIATLSSGGRRADETTRWRPSLVGRLLAYSMTSPRKLPAPKQWVPAPDPRPDVIAEFLRRQRELAEMIDRSMEYEWRRVPFASPVSPLLRMNLGDAFTILVRHTQRHFRQIDGRLTALGLRSHLGDGAAISVLGVGPAS